MHAEFSVTIKTTTHCVFVKVRNDRVHCFKYNDKTCDFAVFDNQFEATEYILEPMPDHYYSVRLENEWSAGSNQKFYQKMGLCW